MRRETDEYVRVGSSDILPDQLWSLRQALSAGALIPVLGAGVSVPYGMPSWKALVLHLLFDQGPDLEHLRDYPAQYQRAFAAWMADYFEYDLVVLSRAVKEQFIDARLHEGKSAAEAEAAFLRHVRSKLYQSEISGADQTALQAVARLVRDGRVPAVVSFNFDDLLERELTRLNVKHHSVWNEHCPPGEGVPILHPHGFLPRDGELDGYSIVFTEDEYHRMASQSFHWAQVEVVHQLRNGTAFFIGLSMSDPNLRRLLDASRNPHRPTHWIVQRRHKIAPNQLMAVIGDIDRRAQEYGALLQLPATKTPGTIERELPDALSLADHYDQLLLKRMAVNTMWIEEFGDVVPLIDAIREQETRAHPAGQPRGMALDPEDPQKGRWGGLAQHNFRQLTALVTPASRRGAKWFNIDLEVSSTDPDAHPLAGNVRFHLHHTFPNPKRTIRVIDGRARLRLLAYGAFTVGAEADKRQTQLELDLSTLPDAPQAFRGN
jgi:hypothetical protein